MMLSGGSVFYGPAQFLLAFVCDGVSGKVSATPPITLTMVRQGMTCALNQCRSFGQQAVRLGLQSCVRSLQFFIERLHFFFDVSIPPAGRPSHTLQCEGFFAIMMHCRHWF